MASSKTLKQNRLMQKTDFASSIVSATRWPSKDQNRHKASSATMEGAENLNGTCWCTTPCLCPTLLFLMTDGSLPHGKVWVECMDNFRGLIDKEKDRKGRKKLKKLLLQHDLMSRQLVHARVVHLESSVLFSAAKLKTHTYKCVYIYIYIYIHMCTNIVQ